MTGGDLLLEIGFEGVKKNSVYMAKMRGKLRDYDISQLRCGNCKHNYDNPDDVVCMVCPVFILATSEFLYEELLRDGLYRVY